MNENVNKTPYELVTDGIKNMIIATRILVMLYGNSIKFEANGQFRFAWDKNNVTGVVNQNGSIHFYSSTHCPSVEMIHFGDVLNYLEKVCGIAKFRDRAIEVNKLLGENVIVAHCLGCGGTYSLDEIEAHSTACDSKKVIKSMPKTAKPTSQQNADTAETFVETAARKVGETLENCLKFVFGVYAARNNIPKEAYQIRNGKVEPKNLDMPIVYDFYENLANTLIRFGQLPSTLSDKLKEQMIVVLHELHAGIVDDPKYGGLGVSIPAIRGVMVSTIAYLRQSGTRFKIRYVKGMKIIPMFVKAIKLLEYLLPKKLELIKRTDLIITEGVKDLLSILAYGVRAATPGSAIQKFRLEDFELLAKLLTSMHTYQHITRILIVGDNDLAGILFNNRIEQQFKEFLEMYPSLKNRIEIKVWSWQEVEEKLGVSFKKGADLSDFLAMITNDPVLMDKACS